MAHGKRHLEKAALVTKGRVYPMDEALALVKQTSTSSFDGAVEVHIQLGINPKKGDQQVRSNVVLPHGTGKSKRVAAFVGADLEQAARDAGADLVGGKELIEQIKATEKIAFDVAVATPDMMKDLATIARILGPRGLMPSPKNNTVTPKIREVIADLKGGMVTFKNDDTSNLHQVIGRVSWDVEKLKENLTALLDAVRKAKPPTSKGTYLRGITLAATMGPGVRVTIQS